MRRVGLQLTPSFEEESHEEKKCFMLRFDNGNGFWITDRAHSNKAEANLPEKIHPFLC